jgi:hypothetical protein
MRTALSKILILVVVVVFSQMAVTARTAFGTELAKTGASTWIIQRADDSNFISENTGDHAAMYDANGVLHVAFGGDHLYYAHCENGTCTIQTVDNSDSVGSQASLTLDSHG